MLAGSAKSCGPVKSAHHPVEAEASQPECITPCLRRLMISSHSQCQLGERLPIECFILKHLAHKYLSTFSQRAHPKKIFIHQPTRTRASTTLSCCTSRKAARKLQVVRQRRIVSATIFRSRAKSLVSSTRDPDDIDCGVGKPLPELKCLQRKSSAKARPPSPPSLAR